MSLDLRFHPSAEEEVLIAAAWYAERSAVAAQAFARELDAVVKLILEDSDRVPRSEHGTRRIVFPRFPFSIFYRIASDAVEVIAVAHQSRGFTLCCGRMTRRSISRQMDTPSVPPDNNAAVFSLIRIRAPIPSDLRAQVLKMQLRPIRMNPSTGYDILRIDPRLKPKGASLGDHLMTSSQGEPLERTQ